MSYTVQAAEPLASATVRGVVGIGAQTFGGLKTFANKVTVSAQGGIALQLDGADYINWGAYQLGVFGGQIYTPNADGYRTQGANGIWMGGVNSAFTSSGMFAASQGYAADLQQGQDKQIAILAAKTGANVVIKLGQFTGTPNTSAELVRMGYGMSPSDLGDGTAVFSFMMDGRLNIAGGSNKELRFAGNPALSLGSAGGVALLGAHADAGAGEASVNIGNSVPLTEGSGRDLVRVRNGNPFSDTLVFSISPGGHVSLIGDLKFATAASGIIRGGTGGLIRIDDTVGFQALYGNNTLTMDAADLVASLPAGKFSISGDPTSPVKAAMRLVPQDAQPTGPNQVGDMYMTAAGVVKVCTVAGSPGTWVSVGAQV